MQIYKYLPNYDVNFIPRFPQPTYYSPTTAADRNFLLLVRYSTSGRGLIYTSTFIYHLAPR